MCGINKLLTYLLTYLHVRGRLTAWSHTEWLLATWCQSCFYCGKREPYL